MKLRGTAVKILALLKLRRLTQIGVYDGGNSFRGLQEDGR